MSSRKHRKGGATLYQTKTADKVGKNFMVDPKFSFKPRIQVVNATDRATWREWTSSSTRSRSIGQDETAVWYEIESQSDRSLFDPTESFVSIEIDIQSSNGTPFDDTDIIVPPNAFFLYREFSHYMDSIPMFRLIGGAAEALTAISLTMDPKTTQSSTYFTIFPNANDVSAASVDPTNALFNKKYREINDRGIADGSVAVRRFNYNIPLKILDWVSRRTSDLNTALPECEHEYRFDLDSRQNMVNNIMYSLGSAAALTGASITIPKHTIWAKYLEPSPETLAYFSENTFDSQMLWLAPDHQILRNRNDTRFTGERVSSYSTPVNKVIVFALDSNLGPAENKVCTKNTFITNASLEFNGVRIYASETDNDHDRFMRDYLIALGYDPTESIQSPLDYDTYKKAYKSLQAFDLSDVSEKRLNMSNELYFSGNVQGSTNFDLHFVVIRHSYANVMYKDNELQIDDTRGV